MTQTIKILFFITVLARMTYAFDWADPVQQQVAALSSKSISKRRSALEYFTEHRNRGPDITAEVIKALDDPVALIQTAAAKAAAARKTKGAVPTLITWLSHWKEKRRLAAADALAAIGDRRAVVPLARALNDPESGVRLRAIMALEMFGGKQITMPLLGALADTHSKVRERAIKVLGKLNDKRALIPLLDRLGDSVRTVRKAAVIALGNSGDHRVGASLARMVNDSNETVALEAIRAMGKLRYVAGTNILHGLFQQSKYRIHKAAARALATLGTKESLRILVNGLLTWQTREQSKQALIAVADKAAPLLTDTLNAPQTSRPAATAIVKIAREAKCKAMAPALLRQLSESRLNHLEILRALQVIAAPVAQRHLLSLLQSDDWELRLASLHALEPIADQRAVAPLLAALEGSEPEVQLAVITHLDRLQSQRSSKKLQLLSRSGTPEIALAAASALVKLRDADAAPTIIGLLSSVKPRLRRVAIQGIATLPNRVGLVGAITKVCRRQTEDAYRSACILALGAALRGQKSDDRKDTRNALAFLQRNLQHPTSMLWHSSVIALAGIDNRQIAGYLIERNKTIEPGSRHRISEVLGNRFARSSKPAYTSLTRTLSEGAPATRAASAWALGKLGQKDTPSALESAMQRIDWQTRVNASASLARLRLPRLEPLLLGLTADENPYVRANAIAGLGWLKSKRAQKTLEKALWTGRSPWARVNAYRALLALGVGTLEHPTLKRKMSSQQVFQHLTENDSDLRVRRAMQAVPKAKHGTDWIALVLRSTDGKLVRNTDVALVAPSGLIKAARTDSQGQLWEEGLKPGLCFVETPPSSVRHRRRWSDGRN